MRFRALNETRWQHSPAKLNSCQPVSHNIYTCASSCNLLWILKSIIKTLFDGSGCLSVKKLFKIDYLDWPLCSGSFRGPRIGMNLAALNLEFLSQRINQLKVLTGPQRVRLPREWEGTRSHLTESECFSRLNKLFAEGQTAERGCKIIKRFGVFNHRRRHKTHRNSPKIPRWVQPGQLEHAEMGLLFYWHPQFTKLVFGPSIMTIIINKR